MARSRAVCDGGDGQHSQIPAVESLLSTNRSCLYTDEVEARNYTIITEQKRYEEGEQASGGAICRNLERRMRNIVGQGLEARRPMSADRASAATFSERVRRAPRRCA
jgi:hypothetical protein